MSFTARKHIFNVGFNFNYWPYYKNWVLNNRLKSNGDWFNVNNHGDYSPHELYVEQKYAGLKEELLNNTLCTLSRWQFDGSYAKAVKYTQKERVKAMKAADVENIYHYGIDYETPLSISNLLSIIAHEDYFRLSTAFSSKFRGEILNLVKSRNREYWNWSKLLHETVNYFGQTVMEWDDEKGYISKESGPFFCGMSTTLNMTQFNIRMYGPFILTKQIVVAKQFAATKGVVLTFDADRYYCDKLRVFDASWISSFKREDARLCIGGHFRMKLVDIHLMETNQQFRGITKSLYLFDCMLNGTNLNIEHPKDNSRHFEFLTDLVNDDSGASLDPYIRETFYAFCVFKSKSL